MQEYKIDNETRDKLDENVATIIEGVLKDAQVRLWKLEVNGNSFYFVLDKADGLNSILLQQVHLELYRMLEAVLPLDSLGAIECVTPGVERNLIDLKHWIWSVGYNVKVRLFNNEGEKATVLEGELIQKEDNFFVNDIKIDISNVKKAKTIFDYEFEMSKGNRAKKEAKKEAILEKRNRKKLKDKKKDS